MGPLYVNATAVFTNVTTARQNIIIQPSKAVTYGFVNYCIDNYTYVLDSGYFFGNKNYPECLL